MSSNLYVGSTHTATVQVSDSSGAAVTSAIVSGTLYKADQVSVVLGSISFTHTTGGSYTATIPTSTTSTLTAGAIYYLNTVAVYSGTTDSGWGELIADYHATN